MTTVAGAYAALKARLESQFSAIPVYWPNENVILEDEPTALAKMEFLRPFSGIAGFGGGRGANLYRYRGMLVAHVLVPRGAGLDLAMTHGEAIAAAFRSFRDADISCGSASVDVGDAGAENGNYWAAEVTIEYSYDQIG